MLVSNSVSLLASLVDSALDLLSTAIIWGAAVAAGSKEEGGKGRTRVLQVGPGGRLASVSQVESIDE